MTAVLNPSPTLQAVRFTREQYHHLGRLGFFDGKRVERLRGEIIEMSPIGWPHVVGCRKTAEILERAFAGIGWVSRNEQPLALAESDPQPDVMVVPGRFEDYTDHPSTALLLVEVADTTLFRDTTTKAEVYAEAGIAEYWVLDLTGRQLFVFRDPAPVAANGNSYRTQVTLGPTESVAPLAAPNRLIFVSDLLPSSVDP
jgi:Uma2 family endonuclease